MLGRVASATVIRDCLSGRHRIAAPPPHKPPALRSPPTDADYTYLLELHTGLRRFLHWSETLRRHA